MKHYALIALFMLPLSGCAEYYAGDGGWAAEDNYWQNNYVNEPYYASGYGYEAYQPAFLFGVETYRSNPGRRYEELNESELRNQWESSHGRGSRLDWQHAREASRAAYNHAALAETHRSAPMHEGINAPGRAGVMHNAAFR